MPQIYKVGGCVRDGILGSGDKKPLLSCGARVVIETESEIRIIS